jgi:hypothetical protein
MLSWIESYPLHFSIIQGMKVADKMHTEYFPRFYIKSKNKRLVAEYSYVDHVISFNETYMYAFMNKFSHHYFHELAHSTAKYTGRFERFATNTNEIRNLEERIADIAACILVECFDKPENSMLTMENLETIKAIFTYNPTSYPLYWLEVECAVKFYLKNKNCPKIDCMLQFFKQVILNNNFTKINEGLFNEQS